MNLNENMRSVISAVFAEHLSITELCSVELFDVINSAGSLISKALLNGNKVLLFGNGGSAGDAQHIAAEFTGRFLKERKGLPAIALTTDTSALTAISNDYGFNNVFKRQVEALALPEDVLVGISTSGNSENVLSALKLGQEIGCKIIGLSGRDGGKMNTICDINIVVNSNVTARIQEMHILIGHIICELVDNQFE